ncbi:puromycin-sensitive aminopeptidase-like [Amphibalanus amphitrite]|uniref:puromycin-sensitive aminopeptidase-like n=1 Tax=Amphibalanus amphitrite TaxID=1232801 RepID=UPI001C901BC5|nr:puromycin-sensitive aminopeptidase-like [Amphibalanus amphitrite]XP_043237160.1 puromycin-sensitive aminopeptidase-like [Amphibalanus amphitrite]
MTGSVEFQRLPKTVVPRHYALYLHPDLVGLTFTGHVICDLEVKSQCSTIVCNSAELEVTEVTVTDANGVTQRPAVELSAELETLTCRLQQPLAPGAAQMRLKFAAPLTDKMRGLYRCKYTSPSGEERFAAATQFEATDARRCFPCWDEPALKATFDITLVAPRDRVALSNMPVSREEEYPGRPELRVVHFATTPIMSTYIIACVVGEFDHIETTSDNVCIRVYTPLGKGEMGRFALDCAAKILPYYKGYFGSAYPLPKLDLIAIPDFASGAMENWGLVTFRETCILVDPVNTSTARRQFCAQVVGHELAHMWFGNLVTMEWWTHLWLNEGYAEFAMYLSTDYLFPHYKIWMQFVSECYMGALATDSLRTSHPIEVPVSNPSEVDEIFDGISYDKGACVIRMLHEFLGHEAFKRGMNLYLKRHQFGNTFTEDLWAALEESSGRPVRDVMSTWTRQTGYPVVRVSERREGTTRIITASQRRCLADGKPDADDQMWMVPLSFSSSQSPSETIHKVILSERTTEVRLENIGPDDWVKLNPGAVGFYRVQYPPEMLEQFKSAIATKVMPALDRNSLVDDLFALVQAGDSSTVDFLRLARSFVDEDEFTVWSCLLSSLRRLWPLLQHTEMLEPFHAYCRQLLRTIHKRLGWQQREGEGHMTTLLRPMVIAHLVSFNDQPTLAEAERLFRAHQEGTGTLHADLRSAAYRAVLKRGGKAEFDMMLKLYREAEMLEEKNRIAHALGSIPDPELLTSVLEFALSDEVRAQESVFVMISVSANRLGHELTWDFYKRNCQILCDRYKGRLLAQLVKSLTEDFTTEERALEVEQFFVEHPHPGAERSILQSLETIRLNAAWLQRDRQALSEYLAQCQ